MSDFEVVASLVKSRRYARDLIESNGPVSTRPWWGGVVNTWSSEAQNALIRARRAAGKKSAGVDWPAIIAKAREWKYGP